MTTNSITFSKQSQADAMEIINATGKKTGLKAIDNWLDNPQTDHKSDWIFRIKVEPFELSLNGEKRKIETIDFFVNNNIILQFYLTNALKDNKSFELQWIRGTWEHAGKNIGFSETRPNALVVDSNGLDLGQKEKNKQNSDLIKDLKVDWKNITILDNGLVFDLTSPQSISLNNRNFTYEKIFCPDDCCSKKYLEWLKKRLIEWKENQKNIVIKDAILSTKSWLSVKDGNALYIVNYNHSKGGIEGLHDEWFDEINFQKRFSNWDKLPYPQKRNFVKRHYENKESYESMKNEIETAIKGLEKSNNNPGKSPNLNQNSSSNIQKVVITISLSFLLVAFGVIIASKKKKKKKENYNNLTKLN